MDLPKHLTPFNPVCEKAPEAYFSKFSQLHNELRLHIWELALQQERMLDVRLSDPVDSSGNPLDLRSYLVTVRGRRVMSKLMATCGESRDVALRFYRVRIPCLHEWQGRTAEGTLYINPDFDTIQLYPGRDAVVEFLEDARESDPRGVGITNLALSHNDLHRLGTMNPAHLLSVDGRRRASLRASISSLRRIYFMSVESAGRVHSGPRNGIHFIRRFEMHRSRPVYGQTTSFERLRRDPRDIDRDLKKVFLGTSDPRAMVITWRRLLESWGITDRDATRRIKYHVLVSCAPAAMRDSPVVYDRDSAVEWLQDEDKRWMDIQSRNEHLITARGGQFPVESPEDLERAPQPAIGFWLFPLKAMGPVPEDESYHNQRPGALKAKRVVNMTKYWPELCLSVLT